MGAETAKIIISAKDETRAAFESVRNSLTSITGLASAIGVGALASAVKSAADFADQMQDAAEKTGLTVKELTELKYAADINGDAFESLQTGLKRLSTQMLDFANGNKDAKDLFKSLGIEVTNADGKLRSSGDVLKDIADRFQSIPNGAQKTALAIQVFGKSGADLIPLLNQGADGMRRFADEAQRLGIVVDTEAAQAASQFNDNMDRLGRAFDGFKLQATKSVIPVLADITEEMVKATKQSGLLAGIFAGFMANVNKDISLLKGIPGAVTDLAFGTVNEQKAQRANVDIPAEIKRLATQLQNGTNLNTGAGSLSNADRVRIERDIQFLAQEKNALDRELESLRNPGGKEFSKTFKADSQLGIIPQDKKATKATGNNDLAKEMQDLANLMQSFQKAAEGPLSQTQDLQRQLDAYRALNPEVQTYLQGLIDQVSARERLSNQADSDKLLQQNIADFDARELRVLEDQSAAEIANTEALEKRALAVKEALDPQLKLMNMQQEYTELLDAGLLSQDEYTAALKKLAESQKEVTDNGRDSFADLKRAIEGFSKDSAKSIADFAFNGKSSFSDMVNSMLKDLATLAIQRGVTDPIFKAVDNSGIFGNIGSLFSGFFGGARANGGPVSSGKAYLVGERGPEIFMPAGAGSIIPNGAGGGMNVSVSVDASGSNVQGNSKEASALGDAIGSAVRIELLRQKRPGGLLA